MQSFLSQKKQASVHKKSSHEQAFSSQDIHLSLDKPSKTQIEYYTHLISHVLT